MPMPDPWTLLALPPLAAPALAALFEKLPVEVVVPAERSPEAVRAAAATAEILLGDWSGAVAISAELVAAAPRLAFVDQPSVGGRHRGRRCVHCGRGAGRECRRSERDQRGRVVRGRDIRRLALARATPIERCGPDTGRSSSWPAAVAAS